MYCASLRTAEPDMLETLAQADAMVVTVLAAGGSHRPRPRPVATIPGTSNTLPPWICRSCRGCV
ncbi:cobalamin biosynthesis N domain protein [Mycobacterium xenopi 4042]|uniref:Cobalamin biosynthesis N domain protein n=1 Tax=Mycobacterium xenopi 4042 TaxID=1299334 RepID=X8BDK8_MYCXE|nr:cobalamin biosynthesis N domain protein [Mycobacterium xenopi 4042]